jgi:hypothetical protein
MVGGVCDSDLVGGVCDLVGGVCAFEATCADEECAAAPAPQRVMERRKSM